MANNTPQQRLRRISMARIVMCIYFVFLILCLSFSSMTRADSIPLSAYANGQYTNLIQVIACPSDSAKYGNYTNYGYWRGGAWCGQQGNPGFWVYAFPNWYVFSKDSGQKASANGRYSGLSQVITCPTDRAQYGDYNNYGYWKGGSWCGQQGNPGFWVYVYPSWHVWNHG